MYNAEARYQNESGEQLEIFLDIDLKSEKIIDAKFTGSLQKKYSDQLDQLKNLIVNHTTSEALALPRESIDKKTALTSLPQWLMHKAIEDYLGTSSTIREQNDLLCLCYGIGFSEIKSQILLRSDYDLPQLVAETFATSACGSCKTLVVEAMKQIRSEHGLVLGMQHSQTHLDKEGKWLKIIGYYPADLIIKLDELKNSWMNREGITDQFQIEIMIIEGHHLWLKVLPDNDADRNTKVLSALSDFWKSEIGALFFLHLI